MIIIAKSVKNAEYLYSARSAHKVAQNAKTANTICELLNKIRWQLADDQVWYAHEVDRYDTAFEYAQYQRFSYGKSGLKEVRS